MVKPDLKARIFRAAAILRKHKISQAELADIVGASQPQVSRILNAKGLRATKLCEEICLYAERLAGGVSAHLQSLALVARIIFPVPLPDETLCSLLTRLGRVNGIFDSREFSSRYFGGASSASFIDAQMDFPEFCWLTDYAYGKPSTVLEELTTLCAQVRVGELGASILEGIESGASKPSIGELTFHHSSMLSYCPACCHHDISRYGFSYWHRVHQIPVALYCPQHNVPLERVRLKRVRLHQAFPIPSDFYLQEPMPEWECSSETVAPWLDVAKMTSELLEGKAAFYAESVDAALLDELRELRLVTVAGRMRQDKIMSFCLDRFMECGGSTQDAEGQRILEQVTRGLTNPHPRMAFGRVLLVYVLFGNWKAFEEKCKWVQVFSTGQKPSMPRKQEISSESELESFHRKICIDYLFEHPGCTRFEFTKAKYRSFRWLLHNDKRWLDKHLPVPTSNMKQLELF